MPVGLQFGKVFVTGRIAALLLRPNPVRRTGFDVDTTITAIDREAADVVSLTLRAAGGGPLPARRPGAHVDVFLPSGRRRQYSLCG
ncbi:hypothetical protein LTT66_28630 [Nocardia gipuzkoensis]|uniref:hypothetical protein n=1 Tax=Nocardia gipuzkoensis TaxID=2749991 RepID=UPI001E4C3B60|nr:hypothetical protein [Nocardia gipuzkoensis]UGT67173.1 hypothetical protein LTT66_28630 [Nocardia gipuzkoensis]